MTAATPLYAGIDTSNYTTSAALCDGEGRVLANIKIPLPVRSGETGLRQSDAVFAHIKNLPEAMAKLGATIAKLGEATAKLGEATAKPSCAVGDIQNPFAGNEGTGAVAAVGCSASPRDEEGSYMPCFLCGVAAAQSMAAGAGAPVYRFSHQAGHVMAAAYSSGHCDRLLSSPFCAFHVSGGTTELLHVTPSGTGFDIKRLGGTLDLNAGQAIDRAGVAMGLRFPCGPALEELACGFEGRLPGISVSVKGLDCNLSGLENLAARVRAETGGDRATAAFVIKFVGLTILELTKNLREIYPSLPVLYAGGVMSNKIIKNMLSERGDVYFAEPSFSSDNAAGIALLCRRAAMSEPR